MLPPIFLSIYNLNGFVSPFWLISFFLLYEKFSELSSQCDTRQELKWCKIFVFIWTEEWNLQIFKNYDIIYL